MCNILPPKGVNPRLSTANAWDFYKEIAQKFYAHSKPKVVEPVANLNTTS